MQRSVTVGLIAFFLAAASCSSTGITGYAARHDLHLREIEGDGFTHLVAGRRSDATNGRLHIYIEGDGVPWSGNYPSADPTPENRLAMRLAAEDPNDLVYVGRPCYFGVQTDPAVCHPRYWTSHRYGPEVVRSMAAAIEKLRMPEHEELVLIGYSGGGVLAALLESEVKGVVAVVTVAANLDIDAWAAFHGYDPLTGSLNPTNEARDARIPHLQYVGSKDRVVPPSTSVTYARSQPGVELIEIAAFDHRCCWRRIWPEVLESIADHLR